MTCLPSFNKTTEVSTRVVTKLADQVGIEGTQGVTMGMTCEVKDTKFAQGASNETTRRGNDIINQSAFHPGQSIEKMEGMEMTCQPSTLTKLAEDSTENDTKQIDVVGKEETQGVTKEMACVVKDAKFDQGASNETIGDSNNIKNTFHPGLSDDKMDEGMEMTGQPSPLIQITQVSTDDVTKQADEVGMEETQGVTTETTGKMKDVKFLQGASNETTGKGNNITNQSAFHPAQSDDKVEDGLKMPSLKVTEVSTEDVTRQTNEVGMEGMEMTGTVKDVKITQGVPNDVETTCKSDEKTAFIETKSLQMKKSFTIPSPLKGKLDDDDGYTMAFNYSVMSSTKICDTSSLRLVEEEASVLSPLKKSLNNETPLPKTSQRKRLHSPLKIQARGSPLRPPGSPMKHKDATPSCKYFDRIDQALKKIKVDLEVKDFKSQEFQKVEKFQDPIKLTPVKTWNELLEEIKGDDVEEEEEEAPSQQEVKEEPIPAKRPRRESEKPAKEIERLTVAKYLHMVNKTRSCLDHWDRRNGSWELEQEQVNGFTFHFKNLGLKLHVLLGHRLQREEKQFRNKTFLIQHSTVQSIELKASKEHFSPEFRLVHHLMFLNLTPSKLCQMCPTTRDLSKTLNYLMLKVHEGANFILDVEQIAATHAHFNIRPEDFRIEIIFFSERCRFSFKVSFCYKGGFANCREKGIEYVRGPSQNNLMAKETVQTLFSKIDVGWVHMKKFVETADEYIKELEKRH